MADVCEVRYLSSIFIDALFMGKLINGAMWKYSNHVNININSSVV